MLTFDQYRTKIIDTGDPPVLASEADKLSYLMLIITQAYTRLEVLEAEVKEIRATLNERKL